ncbi:PEP-CTERM sorting domain-containing protein [[Phormidium] sp. ETS-05]|uniref:PEP-CTERM sorting domain-containing protein n=1 Tax=[Phormidium] sp. ETS-05 TaxID=222819 RepID=UPI0018EEF40B|nr:PEP-CTERM sorting domain-containing protein [[Phormidium] sp. ETS-05]
MLVISDKQLFRGTVGLGLTLGTVLLCSNVASAASFGVSWDDGSTNSLQDHLDDLTVSGPNIDTVGGQTGFERFTNTATGGSVSTFMFEIAGFASTNKFGVYNQSGQKAELFGGSNDVSDQALISFNNGDLGVTRIPWAPGNSTGLSQSIYSGFGNVFGFYLERGDGTTFYTEKSRNGGYEQAVVYQGNNATTLQIPGKSPGLFTDNEFIIAFEDLWLGSNTDRDYQDMVIMVESIKPVPEPATILGLGLIGGALTLTRRRKSS